jgi:hypothetical protein
VFGYSFDTKIKSTKAPPRGQVIQRVKSLSFGINAKSKTDTINLYTFDNTAILFGGVGGFPDGHLRRIINPKQQDWILRYAKVEFDGGFNVKGKAGLPAPPKNGTQTKDVNVYNGWKKFFNSKGTDTWEPSYEYLYINAKHAMNANLNEAAILKLIPDKALRANIQAILKSAKRTLGQDSSEILVADGWLWPNNNSIIVGDFK